MKNRSTDVPVGIFAGWKPALPESSYRLSAWRASAGAVTLVVCS
jgi:hypothetical protein